MHAKTTTISVIELEDIIACHVAIDQLLRCVATRLAQRARTEVEADDLADIMQARCENETARRRLVAAHPNKEERK